MRHRNISRLTVITILALLAVTSSVLLVVSYWKTMNWKNIADFNRLESASAYFVCIEQGILTLYYARQARDDERWASWRMGFKSLGLGHLTREGLIENNKVGRRYYFLDVPLTVLILAFAAYPFIAFRMWGIAVMSSPWWHGILIPLVACAVSKFSHWLLITHGIIGWLRPVHEWLRAYGLGTIAPYGLAYFFIPDAILAATFGTLLGLVGREKWFRFVLLYVVPYLLFPYVTLFATGLLKAPGGSGFIWRLLGYNVLAVVPFAVPAAWLGSRPRRRRKERRRSAGLCQQCGYNLTGNVSGRCPECGTEISSV